MLEVDWTHLSLDCILASDSELYNRTWAFIPSSPGTGFLPFSFQWLIPGHTLSRFLQLRPSWDALLELTNILDLCFILNM